MRPLGLTQLIRIKLSFLLQLFRLPICNSRFCCIVSNYPKVFNAEVEELVYGLECACDCYVILELNGDGLVRECLEEGEDELQRRAEEDIVRQKSNHDDEGAQQHSPCWNLKPIVCFLVSLLLQFF